MVIQDLGGEGFIVMYQALGRGMSFYYSILPSISNPDNLEGMQLKSECFCRYFKGKKEIGGKISVSYV